MIRTDYVSTVQTRDKAREKRLRDYFNLTVQEWEKIHEYQNRVCAICHTRQSSGKRLAVDHSHHDKKGTVRGLLCSHCNQLLGRIENALNRHPSKRSDLPTAWIIIILGNFIDYLTDHPSTVALGRVVISYPGRLGTKKHRKYLKTLKKTNPN